VLRLGTAASAISELEISTKHFKGNCPESVKIEAAFVSDTDTEAAFALDTDTDTDSGSGNDGAHSGVDWQPLLPRSRLVPDSSHVFSATQKGVTITTGLSGSTPMPMPSGMDEEHADAPALVPLATGTTGTTGTSGATGTGHITHLRVTTYPDGGIMRLRARGKPEEW
jgi:allantoicase